MRPSKFDLMRAGRYRRLDWPTPVEPVEIVAAPKPSMVFAGAIYVEAPEISGCIGCAFTCRSPNCDKSSGPARLAFGGACFERNVVYIYAT